MTEQALSEADVLQLRRLLGDSHGIDMSYYTQTFLMRRVLARMRQIGVATPGDYLRRLGIDSDEKRAFVASLTINVTEFFRDAHVYEALRADVIPQLLASGRRRITAWSSACATGEEAYTLAMTLDECLSKRPGASYKVYASDISPRQLAAAKAGTYPTSAIKRVPPLYKRYFVPEGADRVAILPALKSKIFFFQHDLSAAPPKLGDGVDLLLCRNVMIYFSADIKPKIFEMFVRMMTPEAFLVLGGTEVILSSDYFRPADAKNKIYRAVPRPVTGDR